MSGAGPGNRLVSARAIKSGEAGERKTSAIAVSTF
jgi:hypothetical protein